MTAARRRNYGEAAFRCGQATPAVYSVIGSAVLVIPAKGAEQRSRYVRRSIGAFEVATDPEDMINGDANEI
jgi:hypothetical protein